MSRSSKIPESAEKALSKILDIHSAASNDFKVKIVFELRNLRNRIVVNSAAEGIGITHSNDISVVVDDTRKLFGWFIDTSFIVVDLQKFVRKHKPRDFRDVDFD